MIGRVSSLLLCGALAWAQLPPSQASRALAEHYANEAKRGQPRDPDPAVRVDVTVSDTQGRPVSGLTAADFTVEADGKSQKIESCAPGAGQPLRLAVILDDLSLSVESLNAARQALRQFVAELRPGDEAAILRASGGTGWLDPFTSDKAALLVAIDRATFNPLSDGAPPETFTSGTIGAVRGVLEGLRGVPGRKAVLLVSRGLRDPTRGGHVASVSRLTGVAHRASVVFYAVDMGAMGAAPGQEVLLDQGISDVARETGGVYLDGARAAEALSGIARDHAGHYVLGWRAEGFSFLSYGGARINRLLVRTSRRELVARARNGVFGSAEDDGEPWRDSSSELERALYSEMAAGESRVKVTPVATLEQSWTVKALLHFDPREITVIKGPDGLYRGTLEAAVALFGEGGAPMKQITRSLDLTFDGRTFESSRTYGLDGTVNVPLAAPGAYQLRVVLRDSISGRMGTARQFLRADWGPGKLSISSVLLRGELEKGADGREVPKDPEESSTIRSFKAGHRFTYQYELFNLASDAEKRSAVEIRAQIWRDGALILDGDKMALHFGPSENPGWRSAAGTVQLREQMPAGHYVFGLRISDTLKPRSVTQFTDFEVRH